MTTIKTLLLASLALLLSVSAAHADIKIDGNSFPDKKFRDWVLA